MQYEQIIFDKAVKVPKGWGYELLVANERIDTDGYCGKFLVYTKAGSVSSMHFHALKHETFFVLNGRFLLKYINPENADTLEQELNQEDVVIIPPLNNHQLICLVPGTIVEFSTFDRSNDNYRVIKGDSQKV